MMMYSMVNSMMAVDVSVSEPLLVGFLVVLVVLIVLLAVLATIYTAGFRRRLRASLTKVTVDKQYDRALGRVIAMDTSNLEKSVFGGSDVVKLLVKAHEGYKISSLTVESKDGQLFAVDGTDKIIREGSYEFVITSDTKVKAYFEIDTTYVAPQQVFTFDEIFNGVGGRVVLSDTQGNEKNQFAAFETVRISTVADEGYYLARFAINGEEKELVEGVYEFVVTGPVKVDVEFLPVAAEPEVVEPEVVEPEVISITTQFDGIGGVVTMSDANGEEKSGYVAGETVRISTVADEGYYLARFAVGGDEKELVEGVYEFVVTEPIEIAVDFLPVPVVKRTVTVQASENGVIAITNENGEEQAEFVEGEIVRIAAVPNDGYYLSHLVVNGEEHDVDVDLHEVVVTNADMYVSATFEAIPVVVEEVKEEPVVAEVSAEDEEEEDEDEVMFDGHNVIRFNKSFTAKFIQLNDVSKGWYNELKNDLLSYKKVKDRMSWKRESYRYGRENVARLVIRGKTLCIQLPLDPTQFEDTKYKVEDISHIMSSADTPCLYRIKNERRLEYAKDLIAMVMENLSGGALADHTWVDYYQPYDTTLNLIDRQLVKKVVKFNGKTGFGGIVEKLTEDPTKAQESEAAATTDEKAK